MAGGDDGVHRVDWWDAPSNPDIWKKHQLGWFIVGGYFGIYFVYKAVTGLGSSSKQEKPSS